MNKRLSVGQVDCIYIAASTYDARYTRSCVASVRFFYPDIPIRILVGGPLERGLADELRFYWDVCLADLPRGDYGWGFVKLEPLFGPPGERFLVLDSDTVITGPVLELVAEHDEDFVVDHEEQPPESGKQIYYDYVKAAEGGFPIPEPAFLFNTGQWFGKSGILCREDFDGLVDWGFPPTLARPGVFKNGEQGVLNFVVNEQWRAGKIRVARIPLMRWPGHGMHGLDTQSFSNRTSPVLVVHWAGMKKPRQQDMVGADLLAYFEQEYYRRLPAGGVRRLYVGCRDAWSQWLRSVRARASLALRNKVVLRLFPQHPAKLVK